LLNNKFCWLLFLTLLFTNVSLASASETVWVFGNVATPPDEADYSGVLYYEFNFTVQSSNATWITVYPLTVTVVAPLLVMVDVALAQDEQLNMTGQFNNDNTAEIPLDYFVAEEVRQIMAQLGIRKFNELVGRVERLHVTKAIEHYKAKGLDFSAIFH